MASDVNVYVLDGITFSDTLDKYKKAIITYSAYMFLSGKGKKIIREKLVTLLALYMQKGYSKATKEYAEEVLGVTDAAINSMNMEIRNMGFMHKDRGNERINHLSDDIKALVGYLKEGGDEPLIVFKFDREKR